MRVIWLDTPKYVATWRKLFRSLKRWLGVEEHGASPEKSENVKMMIQKGLANYSKNNWMIQSMWKEDERHVRIQWPYHFIRV